MAFEIFPDVRQRPRRLPWSVRQWQIAAWVVFLAGLVIPAIGPVWKDFHRVQPTLTAAQIRAAYKDLGLRRERATTLGQLYSIEMLERDCYQIAAIVDAPRVYTSTPQLNRLAFDAEELRAELSNLAEKNRRREQFEALPNTAPSDRLMALMKADGEIAQAIRVGALAANYRPAFFPPTVPSAIHPSWIGFAKWWGLAWLLSAIPALFFVFGMYRLSRRPVLAEMVYRPGSLLVQSLFWWFTFGNDLLDERGVLELKLDRLKWRFRDQHGRAADEAEVAQMLRQVSGRVLTVEQALARVREAPELVQVRTRRTAFQGLLALILSAFGQMVMSAATAVAQTLRSVTPTSAFVDSTDTRRRDDVGVSVAGVGLVRMTENGTTGLQAFVKGVGKHGPFTLAGEFDAATMRAKELSVSLNVSSGISLTAGQIIPPCTWDYAPPTKERMPGSPLWGLVPNFNDRGVTIQARNGGITVQTAVLNGDGANVNDSDGVVDWSGRVALERPRFSLSGVIQRTWSGIVQRDYRAAFGKLSLFGTKLEVGHADRLDRHTSATHVRAERAFGSVTGAVQYEVPTGASFVLQRQLPGYRSRVGFFTRLREHAPPSTGLLLQYGVSTP